ncbi:nucleic acid binding [Striga asiatica]|uniref:Nucleic acid binding n=1 Tax=Striga asiatica TaxID=4170 RepID=A0A5A7PAI3_STRAF|nr:nucleic acid binding [Striga asiatica]
MERSQLSAKNVETDQELTKIYEKNCLIGKILLYKQLDEALVRSFVRGEWKCENGLTVSQISRNLFMFVFQDKQDLANALKNRPWTIMGGLLMLSACPPGGSPRDLRFSRSLFWVQAHGLPADYLTAQNGPSMGQLVGQFVFTDWEVVCSGKLPYRNFLRLRVVLDVLKPLATGFWLERAGSHPIWVDFKYEKLGVFCYKCGLIGNSYRTCRFPSGDVKYGPWLRADSWAHGPWFNRESRFSAVDRNAGVSLLAVPKVALNLGVVKDLASEEAYVTNVRSMDSEERPHKAESVHRRKLWQRLFINSIDSVIMLVNCMVIFSRIKIVDESEENWTLLVLMAAYLLHLWRKLVHARRESKFIRGLVEILVSIVFLIILLSF